MIDLGTDRLGAHGDIFYAELLKAHEGLSEEESARLNARLVFLLANQVGDLPTLIAALEKARALYASQQLPRGAAENVIHDIRGSRELGGREHEQHECNVLVGSGSRSESHVAGPKTGTRAVKHARLRSAHASLFRRAGNDVSGCVKSLLRAITLSRALLNSALFGCRRSL